MKPYIICHMMQSLDGRIDCPAMEKMAGSDEYYAALAALNAPTTVTGRVTAEIELAQPGKFAPTGGQALGHEAYSKKVDAENYAVIVDTHGTLLWDGATLEGQPLLIVMSEEVNTDYLAYLDQLGISWIAAGKKHVDLPRVAEILSTSFGVKRMTVVGGGRINAAFLAAGLLDEVSLILSPAIDGRGGMSASFDGLPMGTEPYHFTLDEVAKLANGVLWLRYGTKA